MSKAKEIVQKASGTPIKVPGRSPKYKDEFSAAVWTIIEQQTEQYDRMAQQVETLTDSLKLAMNHSELTMFEVKRLGREIDSMRATLKALPAPPEANDDDTEDLKGE